MRRPLALVACLAACAPAASPAASPRPAEPLRAAPAPDRTQAERGAAACHHVPPTVCLSPAPSFAGEVRPVLEKRCFGCHAGDGVAADEHDFTKTDRLRVDRSAILDEVATCSMPPRSVLADADADTLLRWAVCAPSTE